MQRIQPLKKFGQNYLIDKNILLKIVSEINPQPEDAIIEIGPGLGALTEELLKKAKKLTAVEIDTRVIEELSGRFDRLTLINEDFLKIDIKRIFAEAEMKLRVVGNIPYNITSPIIFKLLENISIVNDAVFMVQLEVARRFTAERGTKEYGILAVLLNYFAEVRLCFKVSPNVFKPKPKVESAVIHFNFRENRSDNEFNKIFIRTVKAAFGNRRKTLKNSLGNSSLKEIDFSGSGIDLSLRAEQLTIEDYVKLTEFVLGSGKLKPAEKSL